MTLRNIIVAIILGVVLVAAIIGEGYFYSYSQKQNSAVNAIVQSIQNALKTKQPYDALAEAQNNLEVQTERLNQMSANFPSSPLLDSAIKKDVAAAALAAAKANTLAADPKLGISTKANIIALGQKATEALAYLQSLTKTSASTVALNDAAQNAIELVAAYSNEISAYINSLTSANSGLTASEIADYKAQVNNIVAEVNAAENSLNQIDNIPASSVPDITSNNGQISIINDQVNTNAPTSSQTSNPPIGGQSQTSSTPSVNNQGSNNNQGNSNQGTNSGNNGSTTLGDIVNQENIVAQTTDEVNQLANQIAAEATSSPDSSNPSSPPTDDGNSSSGQIQPQSGPIKLIEGENTF
jgi:hypothetical protein